LCAGLFHLLFTTIIDPVFIINIDHPLASQPERRNAMQIGSLSSAAISAATPKPPEAVEGPGPDHDGDGDDKGGAVKSATAAGVGSKVDVNA
jgi:hypothetical protein